MIFSSAGNRATTRCPLDKSDWTLSTLHTQACPPPSGNTQLEPMPAMPTAPHVRLVLGGARSGKSAFAETMALAHGRCVYVETAQRSDEEMHRRIDKLAALIEDPNPPTVVLTVRADMLDHLLSNERIAGHIENSLLLVTPLDDHEIREIVTGPAKSVGMSVDPALVASIVS